MRVKIVTTEDRDDNTRQRLEINGKKVLSVNPLCECPEDAIIGRDLVDCDTIADLMQQAFKAGADGGEFVLEAVTVPYDEFYGV